MRGWKMAATLVILGTLSPAVATEPKDKQKSAAQADSGSHWFGNWFGRSDNEADQKRASAKGHARKGATPEPKGTSANPLTAVRARAEANYFRRVAICNQLMQIACDTGDEDLQRQIAVLDERVWNVYQQRMARLPSAPNNGDVDEPILDKHLGVSDAEKDRRVKELARLSKKDD